MRLFVLALLAAAVWSAPASAYVVQERGGLASFTNGITLGPDGNLWAVEQGAGTVVRMKPDGTVVDHLTVGDAPTSITTGPGGRVWVAVTGADKLVWFDAMASPPTPHQLSTAPFSDCGPVAVEAGNNGRIYFSLPKDGCDAESKVGYTNDDGSGGTAAANNRGRAYDLHVSGGKLFAPDFDSNVIRRLALDNALTIESTVSVTGGGPDGITSDNTGQIWVTLYSSGRVARFPGTQVNGNATESAPADGALTGPFGIVTGADGRVYVAGSESANLVRIDPQTNQSVAYAAPAGSKPMQIIKGPDEDLWFTDFGHSRLLRFVNTAPRAVTGSAHALAPSAGTVTAKVDPRGNVTTVVFDYGTTALYGSSTRPIAVPQGVGAEDLQTNLPDLAPSTTYHVRVRATNAEGTTNGGDVTFTTPAGVVDNDQDRVSPPVDCNDNDPAIRPGAVDVPGDRIDQDCDRRDAPYPRLTAAPRLGWSVSGPVTRITRLWVTRLAGGETARITCRGRGCPFRSRTFRRLRRGTRKFDRYFRRRPLTAGARLQMRVTKSRTIGFVVTLNIRTAREPRLVQRCLRPGSSRPVRCD